MIYGPPPSGWVRTLDGSVDDIVWKYLHATRRDTGAIDDLRYKRNIFTRELIYRLVEGRIQRYDFS